MRLFVDLGNSCINWARADGKVWYTDRHIVSGEPLPKLLDRIWADLVPPERIVGCSVATAAAWRSLADWCARRWSREPERVQSQARFGDIRNGYRDPGQLGADRWAALIAARELTTGGACIVDCGTAVTVDMLSATGEHLGGVIFPGLALLRRSLNEGTAGIGDATGHDASCLARSTADGVAAGTAFGITGAIERLIDECDELLADAQVTVLMTGGDAEVVAARMGRPTQHVPDLVLRGLRRIADQT